MDKKVYTRLYLVTLLIVLAWFIPIYSFYLSGQSQLSIYQATLFRLSLPTPVEITPSYIPVQNLINETIYLNNSILKLLDNAVIKDSIIVGSPNCNATILIENVSNVTIENTIIVTRHWKGYSILASGFVVTENVSENETVEKYLYGNMTLTNVSIFGLPVHVETLENVSINAKICTDFIANHVNNWEIYLEAYKRKITVSGSNIVVNGLYIFCNLEIQGENAVFNGINIFSDIKT